MMLVLIDFATKNGLVIFLRYKSHSGQLPLLISIEGRPQTSINSAARNLLAV